MNLNAEKNHEVNTSRGNIISRLLKSFLPGEKAETITRDELDDARDLLSNIKSAKNEWISANMNFEFADEQELVDYYSYKIKACEVRYQYLIRLAKEKGIRVEMLEIDNCTSEEGNVRDLE